MPSEILDFQRGTEGLADSVVDLGEVAGRAGAFDWLVFESRSLLQAFCDIAMGRADVTG